MNKTIEEAAKEAVRKEYLCEKWEYCDYELVSIIKDKGEFYRKSKTTTKNEHKD